MKRPECILCGSDGKTIRSFLERTPRGYDSITYLRECPCCGLGWIDGFPDKPTLDMLYESFMEPQTRYYANDEHDIKQFTQRILESYGSVPETIIDIGAAGGAFMKAATDLGVKNVYGVELNKHSRELAAERYGFNIRTDISELAGVKADLIHMGDVIEHLPEPVVYLKSLAPYLKENGIIVVVTPDYDRWITRLVNIKPMEHLFYFNKKTLQTLVETCGYTVVSIGNTTRFRKLKYLVDGNTGKSNPLIHLALRCILLLHLDSIVERIFFHNLNNDVICVIKKVK